MYNYLDKELPMLVVLSHPLITHKLTLMRNKDTGTKDFRENLDEIAELMAYEVCRDLPTEPVQIETPMGPCTGYQLSREVVIVPILRAGIGLLDGIRRLVPTAKVGFVGLYRDEETLEPHEYFAKFPNNLDEAVVMVVDPMLATGGSAVSAIDAIKKRGAKNIKLVCLVGVPEGVRAVREAHPDVDIYLAALDDKLNEIGYIVPGLGDAGDRIFGTK
jgi:uracil phosphoribosyltransferase